MTFDSIIINGDSYSAIDNDKKVYGEFLGFELSVPVYNYSVIGSSNDRICRSTIEYTTQHLDKGHAPIVIIGWSFVRRIEVWYYGEETLSFPDIQHAPNTRFITLDFLLDKNIATFEQRAMISPYIEVHKQLTDFYTQIFLLANWLERKNVPYFFFSAARNDDCPVESFPFIDDLSIVQWCKNNPYIHKLHDFCMKNWSKNNDPESHPVTGHLSENGHKKFALVIKNLLGKQ